MNDLLHDPHRLGDATVLVGVPITVLLLALLVLRDVVGVSRRASTRGTRVLDAVVVLLAAAFVGVLALRFTALV